MALLIPAYVAVGLLSAAVSARHFHRLMIDRFGTVTKADTAISLFYAAVVGILAPAWLLMWLVSLVHRFIRRSNRVTPN